MLLSTCYRIALLVLATGLLHTASAQAQQSFTATDFSSAGAVGSGHAETLASPTVAMLSAEKTANLSVVPEPESDATFYNDSHKDLGRALVWMSEANAVAPKYWNVYTEARIRLQMKDYAGARVVAAKAKELALAASPPNPAYAQLSEAIGAKAQAAAAR